MKTPGSRSSSRNRDKAAESAEVGDKTPLERFSLLTRSVLKVSNKAVLKAEAEEKLSNAKLRKSKRKPAPS
jgi:hypothetical protein